MVRSQVSAACNIAMQACSTCVLPEPVAIQKAANCKSSAVNGVIASVVCVCAHSDRNRFSRSMNADSSVWRLRCQCAKKISDRY